MNAETPKMSPGVSNGATARGRAVVTHFPCRLRASADARAVRVQPVQSVLRFSRVVRVPGAICVLLLTVLSPKATHSQQTDADHYTRYELLAPGSSKFRILYEVTATTPGATKYFNPIRRGSVATDERVSDRMTGQPLRFEVVRGDVARAGGVRGADSTGEYIMVHLARPVPPGGEARILIDKTYEDARSYIAGGDTLVFTRSLGIERNAVVLPPRYELTSVNYPSQIRQEADGRIAVSFINIGPSAVPYLVKARKLR